MRRDVGVITRPVRPITIKTGRPWSQFRADYERPVPTFDRLEAIGVVRSGGSWQAIRRLSEASAVNGFVNFVVFDPSPVMHLNGSTGNAVTYLTGNIVQANRQHRAGRAWFSAASRMFHVGAVAGGDRRYRRRWGGVAEH